MLLIYQNLFPVILLLKAELFFKSNAKKDFCYFVITTPNVYSHTLFYFCLQFEFYSLSFLTFFALKNITHSYQAIQSSNFLWKIFRALQECAALSNGFNAQLRGFFLLFILGIELISLFRNMRFMLDEMLQQN